MAPVDTDVARLRHAYTALGRGDESAALAMLAPDCEWRESAELPGADALCGREAVAEFLRHFLESWERFDQTIEEEVVRGDRIGLLIHLTAVGRSSGVELDTRYAHIWTMRDGLGVRVDAYRDPAALRSVLGAASDTPAAPSASDASQKAT
jgi:ketosteroid isomerase-like protein